MCVARPSIKNKRNICPSTEEIFARSRPNHFLNVMNSWHKATWWQSKDKMKWLINRQSGIFSTKKYKVITRALVKVSIERLWIVETASPLGLLIFMTSSYLGGGICFLTKKSLKWFTKTIKQQVDAIGNCIFRTG